MTLKFSNFPENSDFNPVNNDYWVRSNQHSIVRFHTRTCVWIGGRQSLQGPVLGQVWCAIFCSKCVLLCLVSRRRPPDGVAILKYKNFTIVTISSRFLLTRKHRFRILDLKRTSPDLGLHIRGSIKSLIINMNQSLDYIVIDS